jgi:hypothetical protein
MQPFLEIGDALLIEQKKKEYMKLYKAQWMKDKRKKSKEIRFLLTEKEYSDIKAAANEHNLKLTPFIKHAVQAYMMRTYINPNKETLAKMIQILKMMFINVEDMKEENGTLAPFLIALDQLEKDVRVYISSPPTIESYIIKHIQKHPKHKEELLAIIHTQC